VHGKTVFKNEVRFSIEAKKVIKSMQFRLESYKNDFIEKQKAIQRSNPNFEIQNSKFGFFTKIVNNANVGIEFHKPNLYENFNSSEKVESYPTNFNSIVNSGITIQKFYVEIVLTKESLYGNILKEQGSKFINDGLAKSNSGLNSNTNFNNRNENNLIRNSSYSYKNKTEVSIYDTNFNVQEKQNNYNNYGYYNNQGYSRGNNNYYYSNTRGARYSKDKGCSIYEESVYSKQNNSNQSYNSTTHTNSPKKTNAKTSSLQILLTHYEGSCNYLTFAKACTPSIEKFEARLLNKLKLKDFFEHFNRVSAFGLDVSYILEST
jgi:hypothetical protein